MGDAYEAMSMGREEPPLPRSMRQVILAERDRAREIAVVLEQQTAAALALHDPLLLGTGEDHATGFCPTCHVVAPCPTAVALGGGFPDAG